MDFFGCCNDDSVDRNDFITGTQKKPKKYISFQNSEQPKEEQPAQGIDLDQEIQFKQQVMKPKFTAQDLRKKYANSQDNWQDPDFPHDYTSIGQFKSKGKQIVWKRAQEFIQNPVLFKSGVSPNDIMQGNVGDCYFLSTLAALACYQNEKNIYNIFTPGVSYQKNVTIEINKNGFYAVYVQIWGRLTEMIVDDYFPVYKHNNKPIFCKPVDKQIWVMILQKVWAKYKGNYAKIQAGYPHQVFSFFSNAPCFNMQIDLKRIGQEDCTWGYLLNMTRTKAPTCIGSKKTLDYTNFRKYNGQSVENEDEIGIIPSHSYVFIQAVQIKDKKGKSHKLIKLRNPWAHKQWTGPYCDHDKFWQSITVELKKQLSMNQTQDDGIFFIGYDDFLKYFHSIDSCHHVTENFCSSFLQPITSSKNNGVYFRVTIKSFQKQVFFITHQKALDQNKNNKKQFGRIRMIFSKQIEPNLQYTFESANLQNNWPDNILICQNVQPGKYILYIKCQWQTQQDQFVLSTYSQKLISKEDIIMLYQKIPNFMHLVLKHHAITDKSHFKNYHQKDMIQEQEQININQKGCWVRSHLFLERGGLAYIAAKLQPTLKKKLLIQYNHEQLKKSGFKVKKTQQQKYGGHENQDTTKKYQSFHISPGEFKIIVFKLLNSTSQELITFPPKLRISQTF